MDDEEGNELSAISETGRQSFVARLRLLGGRAALLESGFLSLMRYAALVSAAIVLIGSTVYLGMGLVKQIGWSEVPQQPVSLTADDLAPPAATATASARTPEAQPRKPNVSTAIRALTVKVYRTRFKGYQREDTKIAEQEIVDYVWTEDRIRAFSSLAGSLHAKDGKVLPDRDAVMKDALTLVDASSQTGDFAKQLAAFHNAKKANVCTDVVKTRSRVVSSWDPYASSCPNWYENPVGCPSSRVEDEPYTEKVCALKYPENMASPAEQLASAIQRYADKAGAAIAKAKMDADEATARNMARKVEGHDDIGSSGKLFLAFMAVMFLYLFVAMERHHRNLRALIERERD